MSIMTEETKTIIVCCEANKIPKNAITWRSIVSEFHRMGTEFIFRIYLIIVDIRFDKQNLFVWFVG